MANNKEEKGGKLSARQQRFAEEYSASLNGTDAAIAAGYSARTAASQASRLLKNVNVVNEIHSLLKNKAKSTGIEAKTVLAKLWRWSNANVFDILDFRLSDDKKGVTEIILKNPELIPPELQDCVQEIAQTKEGIRVKMVDKLAAIRLVGLHIAMFTQKVDHTTNGKDLPVGSTTIIKINHRRKGEELS